MLEFKPSAQTRKTIVGYKRWLSILELLIPSAAFTVFLITIHLLWPPNFPGILFAALVSTPSGVVVWLIKTELAGRLERLAPLYVKIDDQALNLAPEDDSRIIYSDIEKIKVMRNRSGEIGLLYLNLPDRNVNLSRLERRDALFDLLREHAPNALIEQPKFLRWQREALIWVAIIIVTNLLEVLNLFPDAARLLNIIFFGVVIPYSFWDIFRKWLSKFEKEYQRLLYSSLCLIAVAVYIIYLIIKFW